MTDGLEQLQRTVRVVTLLDQSFRCRLAGDDTGATAAINEAAMTDAAVIIGIRGGMMIGEIPNPETDYAGWLEYVDAIQAKLPEEESPTQ